MRTLLALTAIALAGCASSAAEPLAWGPAITPRVHPYAWACEDREEITQRLPPPEAWSVSEQVAAVRGFVPGPTCCAPPVERALRFPTAEADVQRELIELEPFGVQLEGPRGQVAAVERFYADRARLGARGELIGVTLSAYVIDQGALPPLAWRSLTGGVALCVLRDYGSLTSDLAALEAAAGPVRRVAATRLTTREGRLRKAAAFHCVGGWGNRHGQDVDSWTDGYDGWVGVALAGEGEHGVLSVDLDVRRGGDTLALLGLPGRDALGLVSQDELRLRAQATLREGEVACLVRPTGTPGEALLVLAAWGRDLQLGAPCGLGNMQALLPPGLQMRVGGGE